MANPQTAPCPFCAAASVREGILIAENDRLRTQLAGVVERMKDWRNGDSADHYNILRDIEAALAKEGKP